jgi:shikimate kinase
MEVKKLFNQRKRFYEQADYIIACNRDETPEQIAEKILHNLEGSQ